MRPALTTLLVLSLTVPSAAADAQATGPASHAALADGARVRLKLSRGVRDLPNPVVGRIASIDGETITVSLNSQQSVTVPAMAVERVQISAGRHSRGRGARIGAAIGAGLGIAFTGTMYALGTSAGNSSPESWDSVGYAGATVVGLCGIPVLAGTGAVIGALAPPGERWETVSRERLQVTAQPIVRKDGVGVGLVVSF
jgi:hypothetical protein